MTQLTRLSQALIDEPLAPRPNVEHLHARSRRRHVRRRVFAVGLLALAIVGTFSITTLEGASTPSPTSPNSNAAPAQLASYFRAAGTVPNATLGAVGLPANVVVPNNVTPSIATAPTNGAISYVGAEYCPFCALQRWALLVALSKFGTFTNLDSQLLSSSNDVFPHLASWSFIGAKYSSPFFTFNPTELTSTTPNASGGFTPLETMSPAQKLAFARYNPQGTLPFVDVGNHYVTLGASASPSVLEGLTLAGIGRDLSIASSPVAQAVDGTANYLIAAMCTMVQSTVPPICATPVIRQASKALATGVPPTTQSSGASTYPTQPPTNAPLSLWRAWSVRQHAFMLHAAATYRAPDPACTIIKISVNSTQYQRTTLGIPPGVSVWSMSLEGTCPPGTKGNGIVGSP